MKLHSEMEGNRVGRDREKQRRESETRELNDQKDETEDYEKFMEMEQQGRDGKGWNKKGTERKM